MSDAALDQLYQAPPAEFTAVRTQLAAAATKRGDTAAARQIIAARKPTLAASIVNRFVHNTPDVRGRLSDLGDQLRAAHSAMDGARLRKLSTQQRRFVDDLSQEALHAAGRTDPHGRIVDGESTRAPRGGCELLRDEIGATDERHASGDS